LIQGIFGGFFDVIDCLNEDGKEIHVGDEVLFEGDLMLCLKNVYEYADYLNSPLGTFVIERKVSPLRRSLG
jgi:hypothetical protein